MTDVTDQRLHIEEVGISAAKDVAPIAEKEVAGSVLASGDTMFGYDYATEED